MFGDPPGNSLSYPQFQAIEQFRVRVLGRPQNQVLAFKHVNETGVALHNFYREIQNPVERLVETVGGGDAADGLMQDIYMRIINRDGRRHEDTLAVAANCVQLQFLMETIRQKWNFALLNSLCNLR